MIGKENIVLLGDGEKRMKNKWNKRRIIHWVTWIVTTFTLVLWIPTIIGKILIGIQMFKVNKEASSIGIIGGADGPTAIYITTSRTVPPGLRWGSFLLLMLGITIALWIAKVKMSKKERETNE